LTPPIKMHQRKKGFAFICHGIAWEGSDMNTHILDQPGKAFWRQMA